MEFRPVSWDPPPWPGLAGDYEANDRLSAAELWPVGGVGPEDVVVDGDGFLWTGLEDGRIVRLPDGGGPAETVASTGGRPLGLELHPAGGLVVCDAERGLLRMAPGGALETVVDRVDGEPLRFANNASVASDGTIYFTDTSRRWGIAHHKLDLLENTRTGRLFRWAPGGEPELLLDGLFFANGVALEPEERYLVVAETGAYRLRRFWLTGPRKGLDEVFVDRLPGFPDNLSFGGGLFWVALPTPRNAMLDRLHRRTWAAHLVARLPDGLQPQPARHGMALAFDLEGRLAWNLQDSSGRVSMVTGTRVAGNRLYLGSLTASAVAVYDLPAA